MEKLKNENKMLKGNYADVQQKLRELQHTIAMLQKKSKPKVVRHVGSQVVEEGMTRDEMVVEIARL